MYFKRSGRLRTGQMQSCGPTTVPDASEYRTDRVLDLQLEPAKYYGQAITLDCVVDFAALGGGLTAGKCRVSSAELIHIDTEQFNADQMRTRSER